MATNLEQRTRAIAEALREVMMEPVYPAQPDVDVAEPVPAAEITPEVTVEEALREVPDRADAEESTESVDVVVPPVETIGSMSAVASMALFGHA